MKTTLCFSIRSDANFLVHILQGTRSGTGQGNIYSHIYWTWSPLLSVGGLVSSCWLGRLSAL